MPDPKYHGEGMAVHVLSDSFSVVPVGPPREVPTYRGQSPSIIEHENSPADFAVDEHTGPIPDSPMYRGRSPAIHVFGEDVATLPPQPPIPSCTCPGGPCTTDLPLTYATWTVDEFNATHVIADGVLTSTQASPGFQGYTQLDLTGLAFDAPWEVEAVFALPARGSADHEDSSSSVECWLGTSGGTASFNNSIVWQPFAVDADPPIAGVLFSNPAVFQQFGGYGAGPSVVKITIRAPDGPNTYARVVVDDLFDSGWYQLADAPGVLTSLYVKLGGGGDDDIAFPAIEQVLSLTVKHSTDCTPELSEDPCPECDDPDNPGTQLPPFTPGYMPIFRKQIGDPTTNLDSFICTFEAGAMALDWHTRGAVQVWGGELIPWSGRTEASIFGSGGNLGDIRQAWQHWGQTLSVRTGQSWAALIQCLNEGRAVILQGDYGVFTLAERCQDSFEGGHAMLVLPYKVDARLLVGDPLCNGFRGIKESSLRAYAEAFADQVFSDPNRLLFAVTRPWAP